MRDGYARVAEYGGELQRIIEDNAAFVRQGYDIAEEEAQNNLDFVRQGREIEELPIWDPVEYSEDDLIDPADFLEDDLEVD